MLSSIAFADSAAPAAHFRSTSRGRRRSGSRTCDWSQVRVRIGGGRDHAGARRVRPRLVELEFALATGLRCRDRVSGLGARRSRSEPRDRMHAPNGSMLPSESPGDLHGQDDGETEERDLQVFVVGAFGQLLGLRERSVMRSPTAGRESRCEARQRHRCARREPSRAACGIAERVRHQVRTLGADLPEAKVHRDCGTHRSHHRCSDEESGGIGLPTTTAPRHRARSRAIGDGGPVTGAAPGDLASVAAPPMGSWQSSVWTSALSLLGSSARSAP